MLTLTLAPGRNPIFSRSAGRKEGARDFQSVEAGQQASGGVVAGFIGENGEGAVGCAENLDDGAHLGNSGVVAHESRDRPWPLCSQSGKR